MSNKRVFLGAMVVALVVVISAGALLASNMGFKLNKQILGLIPNGTAKIGQTYLALPYFRQTGINNAKDLALDIGCTNVNELRNYAEASNTLTIYRCQIPFGTNFSLAAGQGVFVISRNVPDYTYIAVGSHDPAASVSIDGTPASKIGRNNYAMPYHFTGVNAKDLELDMGCTNLTEVRKYASTTNTLQIYRCALPFGTNFTLTPGESYDVIAKAGIALSYVPSHY